MGLFLKRESNRIIIAGAIGGQDVRKVFAALHDAINNRGYGDLILDFTHCNTAFSAAMLPICAHVRMLRESRIDFQIELPENQRIRRIFESSGWAHFLSPRDFDYPRRNQYGRQLPASSYSTSEEQDKLLNEILEKLLSVVPNFNRAAFAAVEWALNEISDNVLNHARSSGGGLIQLSVFDEKRHRVEFTVSDVGRGVPATLRETREELESDVDALLASVKSGVTRNAKEFQGNGLYGTLEICRVGGGKFSLNSGGASLVCHQQSVEARREHIPFSGTTVDAIIDFSEPLLLERALSIDGKYHTPTDFIELRYEEDGLQNIHFSLEEQAPSYRSRIAGKPVRTKLLNLINACPGQQIIIDFRGITVVSSSFADEVFGKLFSLLGPMRFMQSIRLVNITPTVQALIDRGITQRMQSPADRVESSL